jgi:hypothetical protein
MMEEAEMPYEYATPVAVANIVEIERIELWPAGPRIEVFLRHGLRQADGSIRPGHLSQVSIAGARAVALASAKPDAALGIYENVKRLIYADLEAGGDLAGGRVT